MNRQLNPRTLLFILTGLNFFNYFDRFILSSVLESIKHEFTLSDGQAGALSTAFMLGYFLTCPIFGYLGDIMSRKWLIMAGIFIWSLGTFLTGFATDFWHIIICRVIVGVGEASYATISPGLISDTFPPERRNNALTIFYVAIPIGAAIGTLFGSWVGANWGWHWAFLWAGMPGLLLAFILVPFREPRRGESEGKQDSAEFTTKPKITDVFKLFKVRDFNLVVWGYVAYTFALGAYQHWGQAFLQRVHGLSQQTAGNFFGGVMVVAGLVGTFIGGYLATSWQKKNKSGYAWVLGISILAATPLTFMFTYFENTQLIMGCMALAMLLLFFSTGPVNTVIIESVPPNLRASAMAMSIFLIHAFGDLWSPLIVGKISDHYGSLHKGLDILPYALLVGGILWIRLAMRTTKKLKNA